VDPIVGRQDSRIGPYVLRGEEKEIKTRSRSIASSFCVKPIGGVDESHGKRQESKGKVRAIGVWDVDHLVSPIRSEKERNIQLKLFVATEKNSLLPTHRIHDRLFQALRKQLVPVERSVGFPSAD
jgi:hypothetical protein